MLNDYKLRLILFYLGRDGTVPKQEGVEMEFIGVTCVFRSNYASMSSASQCDFKPQKKPREVTTPNSLQCLLSCTGFGVSRGVWPEMGDTSMDSNSSAFLLFLLSD